MLPRSRVRTTFAHLYLTNAGAEPTDERIEMALVLALDFEDLELDEATLLRFAVGCVLDGERIP